MSGSDKLGQIITKKRLGARGRKPQLLVPRHHSLLPNTAPGANFYAPTSIHATTSVAHSSTTYEVTLSTCLHPVRDFSPPPAPC